MLVPTAAPPPAPEGAAPGHAVPPPAPSAVPLPGEPLARPELPLHTAAPRVRGNADELVSTLSGGAVRSSAAGTVAAEGWAAYQRGDLAAAALALGDAASRPDAPAWVHYALGYALLAQGQRQEAEQSWQKVRGLAPEFQAVYFDLADVRVQLGDDAGAVAVLREAEKRWPADPDVYNALGVVQVRRGALDAAVESFEKAVAIAPAEPLGHFNLGRAYQMRYLKSVRYVATVRRWVGNERDRDRAAEQFERYLAIGGPYEQQAREAIASLSWRMPLNP
jgi:tetratricopeptide (TPR) repeat protein